MNSVSFYGSETCGSIGGKIDTAKQECAGSIGARAVDSEARLQTLEHDTVSFHGKDESKKSGSWGKTLFGLAATAVLVIGGLGLAHKYDTVNKVFKKDNKLGKFFKTNSPKVTEPCYDLCVKTKNTSVDLYKRFLGVFKSKK